MRDAAAGDRRESTLADGAQLPLLGLGVWQVPNGRECVDAVRWAFELGYRHIDTAQAYGNEESVGQEPREKRGSRAIKCPSLPSSIPDGQTGRRS
jgi:diketogulonate reductase-like aldo/keto reductase